jgi:hypothetical protein
MPIVSSLAWAVLTAVALTPPLTPRLTPPPAHPPLAARVATTPADPTGEQLLQQMHDRYANKWYHTMTFVQTTSAWDSAGTKTVATWYESITLPGTIRIDFAPRADGNGVMATHDSTFIVQHGAVSAVRPGGNILLTLAFDVYLGPVDQTVAAVRTAGYDLSTVHRDRWQGMPVYVVGADSGNLTTPQFWVDTKRLLLVRIFTPTKPGSAVLRDVRFNQWRPIGGGWIAPNVEFFVGPTRQRLEEYADIKTNVAISPELFDVTKWTTAPHWAP